MQSIGFKNFRRFENLDSKELAGITFFVGGNNAGKSTVVKAMMLMLDNLRNRTISNPNNIFELPGFRLDAHRIHEVHVGTFGRALHKPYPEAKEISFESVIQGYRFCYTITGDTESTLPNADLQKIEIENLKQHVLFVFDFHNQEFLVRFNTNVFRNGYIEINDISQERGIDYNCLDVDTAAKVMRRKTREEIEQAKQSISLLKAQKETLSKELSASEDAAKIASIRNDLKQIDSKLKTLESFLDPFGGKLKIRDVEYKCGLEVHSGSYGDIFLYSLIEGILANYYAEKERSKNVIAKHEEAYFMQLLRMEQWNLRSVVASNSIEYISAHAATQRVLFSIEDKNDYMTTVIREFVQQRITDDSNEGLFIARWMKELKIGLGYKIKAVEGEAYKLDITNMNGDDVPLADMGMGSIQMMILLLKLATIINKRSAIKSLIIIEEPEQNLHPKLQSKLAELLEYVHREYKFRFVIETHSEYIIRKTQAMIATGDVKFEENPFRVYYFPEDAEPYDMVYQESGMFQEKFDEGFFDEASKQQFLVMKKARMSK